MALLMETHRIYPKAAFKLLMVNPFNLTIRWIKTIQRL